MLRCGWRCICNGYREFLLLSGLRRSSSVFPTRRLSTCGLLVALSQSCFWALHFSTAPVNTTWQEARPDPPTHKKYSNCDCSEIRSLPFLTVFSTVEKDRAHLGSFSTKTFEHWSQHDLFLQEREGLPVMSLENKGIKSISD